MHALKKVLGGGGGDQGETEGIGHLVMFLHCFMFSTDVFPVLYRLGETPDLMICQEN